MEEKIERKFKQMLAFIGNTPMYVVHFKYRGEMRTIYAKAEHLNLTGSIKDRMAINILREAYETGAIAPGDTIVEATSGNTGIAFCAIGRAFGHPVKIFMPDWMSFERKAIIKSFGAEEVLVSHEQGGFVGSINLCRELAESDDRVFLPSQFSNEANSRAHREGTGREIIEQLGRVGLRADAFVAGVGTGGTVMGVGDALRADNPGVRVHPLEPTESPTLTTGHKVGKHRIQGISDEFIPPICHLNELDEVVAVSDGDSILMAQKLASCLGLAVGISSGANFLGALKIQNQLGPEAVVTTVFCDSNKKYLSTDLVGDEPVMPEYLSSDIELVDFEAIARI